MTRRLILTFFLGTICLAPLSAEPARPPSPSASTPVTAPPVSAQAPLFRETPKSPSGNQRLLLKAWENIENKEWRAAKKKAKRVIARRKKTAPAWVVLGRIYLEKGRTKKALRRFKKALKYDPHYAAAYYWRGQAFEKRKKLDEAANEYQAALHADPQLEAAKQAWQRLKSELAYLETTSPSR